jgi:hypothetical protein
MMGIAVAPVNGTTTSSMSKSRDLSVLRESRLGVRTGEGERERIVSVALGLFLRGGGGEVATSISSFSISSLGFSRFRFEAILQNKQSFFVYCCV